MSDSFTLLRLLAGEWSGGGRGQFPNLESFEYLETLHFTWDGERPLLHYDQRTRRRNTGQLEYVLSHWETGFLRLLAEPQVELLNAQSGGRVEVLTGSVEPTPDGVALYLVSTVVANDPHVLATSRTMRVEGDRLHYVMNMHTTGVEGLTLHLEGTLRRT